MELYQQFIQGMKQTTLLEYIGVLFGIASVWFSRLENILVYPVGLVNTIIYIYLSIDSHLFGEASVNLYYTIVSIYGWILWAKKDKEDHRLLLIRKSDKKEWIDQFIFFSVFFIFIFVALSFLKKHFTPSAIPWADALASGAAFTAMWLMAKKKVESWYWWIVTNICSIPLYFVKGYVFTSIYYFILLIMAFWGVTEWIRKANQNNAILSKAVFPAHKTVPETHS